MSSSYREARLRMRNSKIETRAQRIVTMIVTVRPARENLQSFSPLWKFEQQATSPIPQDRQSLAAALAVSSPTARFRVPTVRNMNKRPSPRPSPDADRQV